MSEGVRYAITVPPRAKLCFEVEERWIDLITHHLVQPGVKSGELQVGWLVSSIVEGDGPLSDESAIHRCLDLARQRDVIQAQIAEKTEEVKRLVSRQDRLRKNIQAGGKDKLAARWLTELDETEQTLRSIEDRILPELRESEVRLHDQLREALMELNLSWSRREPPSK